MGRHSLVTDEQVAIILEWHRSRRTFEDWARIFNVSVTTIYTSIEDFVSLDQWQFVHKRIDGTGRRRCLSAEQMQELMAWYRVRRTRVALAKELGLSERQVARVVKNRGLYLRRQEEKAVPSAVERKRERLRQLRAENTARFKNWLAAA